MRTPGPNEVSLKLADASAGAGRGESLRAGALVSVVVRERIGPETYRVAIGPRLLTASSSAQFEVGTVLKARVERSGEAVLLRMLVRDPHASAASLLTAAALPNDPAARAAIAALLREGIAPEARALARVRRAAQREAADGGEWTDMAAKMEAKGIPAEGAALEGLMQGYGSAFSGGDQDPGKGTDRGGGRERDQKTDVPNASRAFDPSRDFSQEVPEGELPELLGAVLRGLASRSGGDGALALFNHLRGPEGSWVFVPFHFALDEVAFSGSFRLQLPYIRGGQGRFEADFSASRGSASEDWSFSLSFGGGRAPALRIEGSEAGTGRVAGARIDELAAELSSLSCTVRFFTRRVAPAVKDLGLDLNA